MFLSPRRVAAAAALVLLAVPASAAAHSKATPQSVKAHVRSADAALDMVADLVRSNDSAAAAIAFARNRVNTLAAQREARRLATRSPRAGSAALRMVAALTDEQTAVFTDLVDEASGSMQTSLAKGAVASVKGRDQALAQLTSLLTTLPPQAAEGIARAMAAIMGDGPQEVERLGAAATAPEVSTDAQAWLQFAAQQAEAGMGTALAKLRGLLPNLPAAAQPHVAKAIERISGVMQMVSGILNGIFGGGAAGGLAGSLPIPAGIRIPAGPFATG